MKKNEFLRELENALEGKLAQSDLLEVLSDYGDIFDNGLLEGKSEEEVSQEIGSPASIARTIIDDSAQRLDRKDQKIIKEDFSDLAPMSKRLGAYLVDALTASLLLALLILFAFTPYTTTSYTQEISLDQNGSLQEKIPQYKQRITLDKNSRVKKAELFKDDKRIYKGDLNGLEAFIDKNNIRTIQTKETKTYFNLANMKIVTVLPIMFFFLGMGFSNLLTAFELWIFKGYTLGKWLSKIRVVRVDNGRITFWDAFLRDGIMKCIGNAFTGGILNIVSFLWGCAGPEHKTLHDLVTKTKVIHIVRQ